MAWLVPLLLLSSSVSAQFNSVSQFTQLLTFVPPLPNSSPAYNATPAKDAPAVNLTAIPKVVAATTATPHYDATTGKPSTTVAAKGAAAEDHGGAASSYYAPTATSADSHSSSSGSSYGSSSSSGYGSSAGSAPATTYHAADPAPSGPITIPVQQCIVGTKICAIVQMTFYSGPAPTETTEAPKERPAHNYDPVTEAPKKVEEMKDDAAPPKVVYVRAPPQFVFAPAPLAAAPLPPAAVVPAPLPVVAAPPPSMMYPRMIAAAPPPPPPPMFAAPPMPLYRQAAVPLAHPPPPPAFFPPPSVSVFAPTPLAPAPPMPRPSFIPFAAPRQQQMMMQQQPVPMFAAQAPPPPMFAPQPLPASLPFPPQPSYMPAPAPPVLYNSPFFFRTAVQHAPPMAAVLGAPVGPVAYPPAAAPPQMTVPCSPMMQMQQQQPCNVQQGAPLAYTVSAPSAINAANAAFAAQIRQLRDANGQSSLYRVIKYLLLWTVTMQNRGTSMGSLSTDLTSVDANWPVHLCVGNIVHQLLFGHIVKHAESGEMRHYQDIIEDAMKKVRSEPCVPLIQAYPWMMHLPYVGWRGYGEMRSVALELIHYVESEIKKHQLEMSSSPDDTASTFVGAYLEEMKRSEKNGSKDSFHMDNLVNTATDIWLAGMETAATSIRWGLLLLTAHPEIQERLYEEIQKTIGKSGRRLTMADKPAMPYASAFIYEVHRVANVVTFNVFRRNFEDDTIGGHNVPAGTTILPQISTVMSSEHVFANPDCFDPERYLERYSHGLELRKDVIDRVVAFSLGKRQCAGEALARTEMFLVLLSIVQRYRLEPTESVDIEPVFGILQTPAPSKWRLVARG